MRKLLEKMLNIDNLEALEALKIEAKAVLNNRKACRIDINKQVDAFINKLKRNKNQAQFAGVIGGKFVTNGYIAIEYTGYELIAQEENPNQDHATRLAECFANAKVNATGTSYDLHIADIRKIKGTSKGQLPIAFVNGNGRKTVFDVKLLEQLLLLVGGEMQITLNINDTGPALARSNIASALIMPLRVKDTSAVYVWGEEEND